MRRPWPRRSGVPAGLSDGDADGVLAHVAVAPEPTTAAVASAGTVLSYAIHGGERRLRSHEPPEPLVSGMDALGLLSLARAPPAGRPRVDPHRPPTWAPAPCPFPPPFVVLVPGELPQPQVVVTNVRSLLPPPPQPGAVVRSRSEGEGGACAPFPRPTPLPAKDDAVDAGAARGRRPPPVRRAARLPRRRADSRRGPARSVAAPGRGHVAAVATCRRRSKGAAAVSTPLEHAAPPPGVAVSSCPCLSHASAVRGGGKEQEVPLTAAHVRGRRQERARASGLCRQRRRVTVGAGGGADWGRRPTLAAAALIAPLVGWQRPPVAVATAMALCLRRWPAAGLVLPIAVVVLPRRRGGRVVIHCTRCQPWAIDFHGARGSVSCPGFPGRAWEVARGICKCFGAQPPSAWCCLMRTPLLHIDVPPGAGADAAAAAAASAAATLFTFSQTLDSKAA